MTVTKWSHAFFKMDLVRTWTDPDSEQLRALMGRMADGDSAAMFEFMACFRDELAAMIRSILGSLGRRDVGGSHTDIEFLVASAALVVFDRSPRWQPDGAAPWVWAQRAIRAEVVCWLGHPRVEFVADLHATRPVETAPMMGDVNLAVLAEHHHEVAAWLAEVREVASERDQQVHIEYQTQKSLGDPSPAITVGKQFGLKPDNVRQIDARVRKKLTRASAYS